MISTREFQEKDLESIKNIHFFMWLQLQWQKDFHKDDAIVAVDEDDSVIGVAALSYGGTWYYIESNVTHIPEYYMQFECHVQENHPDFELVKHLLIDTLKKHFATYKEKYPDKKIVMRCWCEDSSLEEMEQLLKEQFTAHSITPVLSFDLTGEIPNYTIPESISIGIHSFEDDGMKQYMEANELGFDNVRDSEHELWFRLNGDTTKVFVAKDGDKVVSSVTVWGIGDGRSATENIFTIPDYRHKNIARETIATSLRYLKELGETQATLSVVGENIPAITLYLGMGYHVFYNLFEMHYTP